MKKFFLLLAAFAAQALAGVASACPMCKDSISSAAGPGGDFGGGGGPGAMSGGGLPGGFNSSVYIMLLGLFGTLGMVGYQVVKGARATNAAMGAAVGPGATAAAAATPTRPVGDLPAQGMQS